MLYEVTVWASQQNAAMPGYAQLICVHDGETDDYLGEWRGVDERGCVHAEFPHHVIEEEVWAKCVFSAIRRFREWQSNGKDRDWLLSSIA